MISEDRKNQKRPANDEEHLAAARCMSVSLGIFVIYLLPFAAPVYRPHLKMKSDADILREAKLEAMGLPPEEGNRRQHRERTQMATDEMVLPFHVRMDENLTFPVLPGHGAIQEENA